MNLMPVSRPRSADERIRGCLKRGTAIAAAAAEYCAAGERRSAWQAYCLAQSQYRSATEILLLAGDLGAEKRAAIQGELHAFRDALAKVYNVINDVTVSQDSGGDRTPSPRILLSEVMAAGVRLTNALHYEEEFDRLTAADTECLQTQLHEAEALVEMAQQGYDRALTRYRDALHRCGPPHPPLADTTILVLEDEPGVASYLKASLERRGSRILEAATGPLAVTLCERYRREISMVIADVVLSSGTFGLDIACRMARCCPSLPVLFISGRPQQDLEDYGVLAGSARVFERADFLQQPFAPEVLETRVRMLLNR